MRALNRIVLCCSGSLKIIKRKFSSGNGSWFIFSFLQFLFLSACLSFYYFVINLSLINLWQDTWTKSITKSCCWRKKKQNFFSGWDKNEVLGPSRLLAVLFFFFLGILDFRLVLIYNIDWKIYLIEKKKTFFKRIINVWRNIEYLTRKSQTRYRRKIYFN